MATVTDVQADGQVRTWRWRCLGRPMPPRSEEHQPLSRLSRHAAGLPARPAEPGAAPTGLPRAWIDRNCYYGGWINNRLEPDTTYYYRVAAVDRWNNESAASPPVAVTTLKATDKNMAPLSVACLRAILVSPLSRFNVVNLLWRTSCESDVRQYEIHRSPPPVSHRIVRRASAWPMRMPRSRVHRPTAMCRSSTGCVTTTT